jgi:hypothetical protein
LPPATTVEAQYEFTDPTSYRVRTFMGRLVKGKDPLDTVRIATRIAVSKQHVNHAPERRAHHWPA